MSLQSRSVMQIIRAALFRAYVAFNKQTERTMNTLTKTLAAITLTIALVGTSLTLTASSADAGPRGKVKPVSTLDLGSSRRF